MPLVYGCIAPHGGEIVPALAGKKLGLFSPTRRGVRALARQLREANPETIVVASPHNLRLWGHIGVVLAENTSGTTAEGKLKVHLRAKCDKELAKGILDEGEHRGLPVVGANFGVFEGPLSNMEMDWGTLVPLWFFLRATDRRPKVVIVTPSREVPLGQNFMFGKAIAVVAERSRKRIALVASSDQAHTHRKDGPYGYDQRAKDYDAMVLECVKEDRLASIMGADPALVEAAKPDSLWQMTILAGALSVVPMKGELLSYQVPTYYGMLCAGYSRTK